MCVTTLTGYGLRARLQLLRDTRDEIRDGFKFRGGHPALDFAATLTGRLKREPRDLLATPRDLARWLIAAELTREPPRVTVADLDRARELREGLYRLSVARSKRRPLPEADRALLNHWAAKPPPPLRLEPAGLRQGISGAGPLLAALARSAVELLGGSMAPGIRGCAGQGCSLLFLDTSRAGRRRWCSMAACGNRAKVARFREGASA